MAKVIDGQIEWLKDEATGAPVGFKKRDGTEGGLVTSQVNPVTGGGEISGVDLGSLGVGLTIKGVVPQRYFCETVNGTYVRTYNSSQQLQLFTGDISTGVGATDLAPAFKANWGAVSGNQEMYDAASVMVSAVGGVCAIEQLWKLSTGNFLMLAVNGSSKRFLHRINGATWDCGTSANNRVASLNVGATTFNGAGVPNIKALHQRSLCEAIIPTATGKAKIILFAEYNVASGRVAGGVNDQVVCWKSTDDGLTFTKLLEFNTDGTRHFSHFHSVIQNPYSGLIYFLTGDANTGTGIPAGGTAEHANAVIVWDGVSTPPAANASNATIAATPGWGIIYGDELRRFGDLVFLPDGSIVGLPDSDTDPLGNAFVSCRLDPALKWVTASAPLQRTKDIPPLIGLRCRNGEIIYGSLRTQGANTAAEPYMHFWGSIDGVNFRLAAKVKNYLAGTGNILDLWQDSAGNVIAGVTYGRGVSLSAAAVNASCAIFTPSKSYGPTIISIDA